MKIFVTGATGFIGSHFVKQALKAGHKVVALRRKGSKPRIPLLNDPAWIDGELTGDYLEVLHSCHAFVHLASAGVSPKNSDWLELFRVNVSDSINIWQRGAIAGIRRYVICGSCFEYGKSGDRYYNIPPSASLQPTTAYGASKAAATKAAIALTVEHQLETVVLRPFHVFGIGQSASNFWPSLRRAALAGEEFTMTPGEQIRDFIPVEIVAQHLLAACTRNNLDPGETVVENIGSGQPKTLREFAEYWWNRWNAEGELLFGAIPYRDNEVMRYVPEISVNSRQ